MLLEGNESPYANIVVVHEDSKDDEVCHSDETSKF